MAKSEKQTPFEFYSLSFKYGAEMPMGGRLPLDQAVSKFNELFNRPQLPIKRNGISEILPSHIYKVEENVYMIRLHNRQIISYIKEETVDGRNRYSADTIKSYPYMYVVIDNRDGNAKMALMKSPVFGNSLDKLCRMLTEVFSQWMDDYGLEVEIDVCRLPMKFWTYVKKCQDEGHRLLSMNIHFYNRDYRTTIGPKRLTRNVQGMLNLARITNALRGVFKLEAAPASSDQMELRKSMKDIAQIVGLCSTNDFLLEVQFQGLPIYKYNGDENVKAIFPMPASAITEMIESEDNPDRIIEWAEGTKRGLVIWLDKCHKEIFMYKAEASKHARRQH